MNNPKHYQSANQLQRAEASKVASMMAAKMVWETNSRLLDIGCGDGDVLCNIILPKLPRLGSVMGVDISDQMVKHADETYSSDLIKFKRADIGDEATADAFSNEFTHISSFFCLHWVQNQGQVFRNFHHLLEMNGNAFVVFLAKNEIFSMYERMSQHAKWQEYMTDWQRFTSPYQWEKDPCTVLRSHIENSGLTIETLQLIDRVFNFNSRDEASAAVKAVNPFVSRLNSEEADQFIADCVDVLCQIAGQPENGYYVSSRYQVFVVQMRRES